MDLVLGEESGLTILRTLNEEGSVVPVIVMTGHGSIETVSEALRLNAFDYITKSFSAAAIVDILRRAVEKTRQSLADMKEKSGEAVFPSIIGQSHAMIEVFKAIARVSGTDATVLVTGESGTGKELVARAIHDSSVRRRNAFIAVNCGAFTDTLLESELFGHAKGAFTGAGRIHRGIFESASGGTVFLDEISETSAAFQVKLLRVLQERKIRPAGSNDESPVDIRVIAATNRPIQTLMSSPNFRRDLMYRLSVINIHIPPLRERADDIPYLVKAFLKKFNRRQNKKVSIPPATLDWMKSEPWYGNVRELENAIERAVTMNVTGQILPQNLKQFGLPPKGRSSASIPVPASLRSIPEVGVTATIPVPKISADDVAPGSLDEMTRDHIVRVLKHTGGNKLRAAELLGVGRWSLYLRAREEILIQARQKGVDLVQSIGPQLPQVMADRIKMNRVFANLLGNALKFTAPGGRVRIEAQLSQGESIELGTTYVQVSVADTGDGIPPEHLSYIFDPYWQSSHKGVGTGLGLAIVKRIVSAHGGTWVCAASPASAASSPSPYRPEDSKEEFKQKIAKVAKKTQLEPAGSPAVCDAGKDAGALCSPVAAAPDIAQN